MVDNEAMSEYTLSEYTFARYLSAKKSVDDRALNRVVWQKLHEKLKQLSGSAALHVLEVGGGIGTMIERTLNWGLFDTCFAAGQIVNYRMIDVEPANIKAANQTVGSRLSQRPANFSLTCETADVLDLAGDPTENQRYDLLIAHAVLDLLDLRRALPLLRGLIKPGGLLYATINFDGATILQPVIDPTFDDAIESLYHRTMDERITAGHPSGDSRTGRHMFGHLRHAGLTILEAGSSDWVVFAEQEERTNTQSYVNDEAYFLHFIINTMHGALRNRSELDQLRFDAWIAQRHAQIEQAELVYLAHQLDFLAEVKSEG